MLTFARSVLKQTNKILTFLLTVQHLSIILAVNQLNVQNLRMFIGPCIIVIVEELETNLMSLVIFITLNICSTCFEH